MSLSCSSTAFGWLLSRVRAVHAISAMSEKKVHIHKSCKTGIFERVCVQVLGVGVGLLFCNYSPSCVGPFSPTLKGCCDSWQRRLLVFIEGNRCWAAWNGAVMCGGMEGALLTLLSLGSYRVGWMSDTLSPSRHSRFFSSVPHSSGSAYLSVALNST